MTEETAQLTEEVCKGHSGFHARLSNVEKDTAEQWTAINKIMNRPPIWTTVIISLLTFLLGCALTYARLAISPS